MKANRAHPHVLVLPEDDANSQVANGFLLEVDKPRQLRILSVARGWLNVLEQFAATEAGGMRAWPSRAMILLLDFDGQLESRKRAFQDRVPEDLRDRTFLLGTLTEPEQLKRMLGNYEAIGSQLARSCRDGTDAAWQHELLRHNAEELERLRPMIRPMLFREP